MADPNATLTMSEFATVYRAAYKAQGKWKPLGLRLQVEAYQLNSIRGSDDAECLDKMLTYWLKNRTKQPTWGKLVEALRDFTVGEDGVADDIVKQYLGGKEPSTGGSSSLGSTAAAPVTATAGRLGELPKLREFTNLSNPSRTKSVQIINQVQADWEKLVDFFELPSVTVTNLKAQPGYKPESACREVFKMWLDTGDQSRMPKDWNTVIDIITDIGNKAFADKIRDVLTS